MLPGLLRLRVMRVHVVTVLLPLDLCPELTNAFSALRSVRVLWHVQSFQQQAFIPTMLDLWSMPIISFLQKYIPCWSFLDPSFRHIKNAWRNMKLFVTLSQSWSCLAIFGTIKNGSQLASESYHPFWLNFHWPSTERWRSDVSNIANGVTYHGWSFFAGANVQSCHEASRYLAIWFCLQGW